jgi:type I restriction enzyme S subunit
MNPQELLNYFDRISEAPDAIPRLRQFILDLAVRGKLVEQDPNDEPASELLKRIKLEKEKLTKEKNLKKQKSQLLSSNEELVLPLNWEPTRIGELLTVVRGASPRPKGDPQYFSVERTPYHWVKISDIRKHSKGRELLDTDEFLTEAGMKKSVLLPKGTLILTNSATIGVPIFLGIEGGCIHDGYLGFPNFPELYLSKEFFFILMQTLQSYAIKKARGIAQLNLNTELVREFPIGLPPLAEQHRIVAKVDELMTLCDKLEATQKERENRLDRLVKATLSRVSTGEESITNTRFFLDNIPHITTRPQHIKQLRQTILDLAVRGKLVEQDPNDEPVNIDGYIDKIYNRFPFEIPESWQWVKLSLLGRIKGGGTPSKSEPEFWKGNILWVSPKDMKYDYIISTQLSISPQGLENCSASLIAETSLLFVVRGMILAHSFPIAINRKPVTINQDMKALELFNPEFGEYLLRAIKGLKSIILSKVQRSTHGTCRLESTHYCSLLIPLPPLAEQQRIVAKVDELMAICDKLETRLDNLQTENQRLFQAILQRALS